MKKQTVLYTAATAAATAAVLASAATNVCNSANAITAHQTITLNSAETRYDFGSGQGCSINDDINIVIDATMKYGNADSPLTTVAMGPGVNVGRRSHVTIKGQDAGKLNEKDYRAPYAIQIHGNMFYDDAMIAVTGAFAPKVVISILGNRFNTSTPLGARGPKVLGDMSDWVSNVAIDDVYLHGTTITIAENNLYGSDINGVAAVYAVSMRDIYYFAAGSAISVTGNNITAVCNPAQYKAPCAYGVHGYGAYMYNEGSFAIDRNRMHIAGGALVEMPAITNIGKTVRVSFDENYGTANTLYVYHRVPETTLQPLIRFGSVRAQGDTAVSCSLNRFTVTGSNGMIGIADIDILERATVTVRGNAITTEGCDPGAYVMDLTTSDESKVTFAQNDFYRDDDTAIERPMLYVRGTFALKGTSTLEVSGNNQRGREPVTAPSAILLDLGAGAATSGLTLNGDSTLGVCNNRVHGVDTATDVDSVRRVINSVLHGRVRASGCAFAFPTTTTTTTTTRATTTTTATTTPTTTTAATTTTVTEPTTEENTGTEEETAATSESGPAEATTNAPVDQPTTTTRDFSNGAATVGGRGMFAAALAALLSAALF